MLSEPADNSTIAGSSRFSFPHVISESTAHSRSVPHKRPLLLSRTNYDLHAYHNVHFGRWSSADFL
jgi:hypothetical protein